MKYKSKKLYLGLALVLLTSFIGLKSFADKEESLVTEETNIEFSSLNDYYETVSNVLYDELAKDYDIEVNLDILKEWSNDKFDVNKSPNNKYELHTNPEVLINILGEDIFYNKFKADYINSKLMEDPELDVEALQDKIMTTLEKINGEILELKENK